MRMRLAPTAVTAAPLDVAPGVEDVGRFRAFITVEDEWSGDGRMFTAGALTWLDHEFPLMGLDTNTEFHLDAVICGHFDPTTIRREGNVIVGEGPWSNTADASRIRAAVRRKDLRGVSVDADSTEEELLIPQDDPMLDLMLDEGDEEPEGEVTEDGEIVVPMQWPRLRVTSGRIVGATIVPFPAYQGREYFIEDLNPEVDLDALAASADHDYQDGPLGAGSGVDPTGSSTSDEGDMSVSSLAAAAGVTIPVHPPSAWFNDPHLTGPTPVTIGDDGRVFGHLATWNSCHIGYPDRCVPPPRSMTGYAHFHTGEMLCDDGARLAVGHITFGGGHAALDMTADEARAHYDDVSTVGADVRAGEDKHGIWIAGALDPSLTAAQVRRLMASDQSGDWRRIDLEGDYRRLGGNLELINSHTVNVGGYYKPRAVQRVEQGLVASMIVSNPVPPGLRPATAAAMRRALAASIGRDPARRRAELRARVHAGDER